MPNVVPRTITEAFLFEMNNTIHCDMMLPTVVEEISKFVRKHKTRLERRHINTTAIQLLDNSRRQISKIIQLTLIRY